MGKLQHVYVATVCTGNRLEEFKLLKRTLERYHRCTWYVTCDTYSHTTIKQYHNVVALEKQLQPARNTGESFQNFTAVVENKMESMIHGINQHGWCLFLDTDLIFLNKLDGEFTSYINNDTKRLFVTDHYSLTPRKYGRFNAGMIAMKDVDTARRWSQLTYELSCPVGLEQKPIESLVRENKPNTIIAGPQYNYGWWRDRNIDNVHDVVEGQFCVNNKPVVNLHVHTDKLLQRARESRWLAKIKTDAKECSNYQNIL